jgi:serine/threonine-protein phosphatase 2A regulatory subunit B'
MHQRFRISAVFDPVLRRCLCYWLSVTDVSASDQLPLLIRKLHQCCTLFDFDDSLSEIKSKEVKRACLSELVEYFSKSSAVNSDAVYIEVTTMVSYNCLQ